MADTVTTFIWGLIIAFTLGLCILLGSDDEP